MYRFVTTVFFCLILTVSSVTALALPFEEFKGKMEEFLDEKIKPDAMQKLVNEALTGDAKGNAEYESYVYAIRSNLHWLKSDNKKALTDAQKSVELNPKTLFGYMVLGDVLTSTEKYEDAAQALEQAAANAEEEKTKKSLLQAAKTLRLQGKAVTPTALWNAFDENEVAAEEAYKGKLVTIKGKISSITTSATGYPNVNFTVDRVGIHKVTCEFDKDARAQIGKLKKGQQVFISGTCQGMLIKSVFLRKSNVIE